MPVQPIDTRPGPNGTQIPIYQQSTPGFGGALLDIIKAISGAVAPRGLTQRGQKIDQAVDQASNSPQTTDLGNQF